MVSSDPEHAGVYAVEGYWPKLALRQAPVKDVAVEPQLAPVVDPMG